MFKINDFVVYKRDVCKINNIKDDFYVLSPIEDESLTINVPIENKFGSIRSIISKKEVENIINDIPNIKIIENINDKMMEMEYKKLLQSGEHKDLVTIIKTTYLRNANRLANKKKIGEKDDNYFKMAEKLLYDEFSIALNMSYDEVKEYVVNAVGKL